MLINNLFSSLINNLWFYFNEKELICKGVKIEIEQLIN